MNVLMVPSSASVYFDESASGSNAVAHLSHSVQLVNYSGSALRVVSYNTSSLNRFSVEGRYGSLFSVNDALTGSLFSVNDISGLPILEVQDDDEVRMGSYNALGLIVSASSVTIGSSSFGANAGSLAVAGNSGFIYIGKGFASYNGIWLNNSTNTNDYNFISSIADQNLYINRPSGYAMAFRENNGNQMIIETGGNIGIGTDDAVSKLNIHGMTSGSTFTSSWGYYQTRATAVNAFLGSVGVGTQALTQTKFYSYYSHGLTSGNVYGARAAIANTQEGGQINYGLHSNVGIGNSNSSFSGAQVGLHADVTSTENGMSASVYIGGELIVSSSGLITQSRGASVGVFHGGADSRHTLSDAYSLYIQQVGGSFITRKWGLFQSGSGDSNFFAGNIGVKTTVPIREVHVLGTVSSSNATVMNTLTLSGSLAAGGRALDVRGARSYLTGSFFLTASLNLHLPGETFPSAALSLTLNSWMRFYDSSSNVRYFAVYA